MDLKATIASGYRLRLILISLMVSFMCAYFFYDGAIAYPAQKEVYDAYLPYRAGEKPLKDWPDYARSQGWPPEQPKERTQLDINTQLGIGALLAVVALGSITMLVRWNSKKIEADADGIKASGGKRFTWDQVTHVDASRWDKKGIARVYYDAGSGEQTLVIDDWKLERKPADAIFDRLRENIEASKVEGLVEQDEPADTDSTGEQAAAEDGPVVTKTSA